MAESYIPKAFEKFEIQTYSKKPGNLKALKKTHVPFTGSPRKHPYDGCYLGCLLYTSDAADEYQRV